MPARFYSLTVSPIQNALEVVQHLPAKAVVHPVTHSRGGLVGELLCIAQRDKNTHPLLTDLLQDLFTADRTLAEQIGLYPLDTGAAKARDATY